MLQSNSPLTLFLSDIHLSVHDKALQNRFLQFLQGPALKAQYIYILGDLFDVWVGEDIYSDFHQTIQQALHEVSKQGIQLFFMAGNRDFLIQKDFLKKSNLTQLSDPCLIDLYGTPTLLTHGDLLCAQDIAYQRYRRIAQHRLTQKIFLSLPKKMRMNIGQKLRLKSQRYQQQQAAAILDVCPDAVIKWFKKYPAKQFIHGHVHRPKVHSLCIQGDERKRIVLGDWYTTGSVYVCTPSQSTLITYDPNLSCFI